MIISEGMLMGLVGGAIGTLASQAFIHAGRFSLSQEGLSINVSASWGVVAMGLCVSAGVGVLAGLVPAWNAGRREISSCFRAV